MMIIKKPETEQWFSESNDEAKTRVEKFFGTLIRKANEGMQKYKWLRTRKKKSN